jgi:lipoprotein-releasing system permease protein
VIQKSREIGILKAMGIKDLDASLIFMYQGFLIGLVGSTIGVGLGLALLYSFTVFTTGPEGSTLIDITLDVDFILISWLAAIFSATIAGLFPARRSLKLNPVDVIRE